jgi:hypothetical protein
LGPHPTAIARVLRRPSQSRRAEVVRMPQGSRRKKKWRSPDYSMATRACSSARHSSRQAQAPEGGAIPDVGRAKKFSQMAGAQRCERGGDARHCGGKTALCTTAVGNLSTKKTAQDRRWPAEWLALGSGQTEQGEAHPLEQRCRGVEDMVVGCHAVQPQQQGDSPWVRRV